MTGRGQQGRCEWAMGVLGTSSRSHVPTSPALYPSPQSQPQHQCELPAISQLTTVEHLPPRPMPLLEAKHS